MLRFEITFTASYPERPPVVTFLSDVFHPLVAPLTTYTHTSRAGSDRFGTADDGKLPPGGLTLRHGFPEWYVLSTAVPLATSSAAEPADVIQPVADGDATLFKPPRTVIDTRSSAELEPPHVIEVLQYMRVIFDTDAVIDSVPLDVAANPGAWHAWKSYHNRVLGSKTASPHRRPLDVSHDQRDRSMSPNKQQPGGARRPGEWNWNGVWEDRVKKAVQASISDATLFGGEESKVVSTALEILCELH